MKKIYILVFVDLRNNGYNCKDVKVYTDKVSATKEMREQYFDKFRELHDPEKEDPFTQDSMDYQFTDGYAYLFGEYYWDIFEKEIPEE